MNKDYFKHVKTRNRDITFGKVKEYCSIHVEVTAIPSFYKLPLEPYSKEFLEIEKAGLEYIRCCYKNLREILLTLGWQYSSTYFQGNQREFLVFAKEPINTPIQIIETINIGVITTLPSEIIVDFTVYGMYGRPFNLCKKGSPEWSQFENRVLDHLYSIGMIELGTYKLSSISADRKFHFMEILNRSK